MHGRALLIVIAAASGACGGTVVTVADAGAPIPLDGGCASQAAVECRLRDTCTSGIGAEVDYGGAAACTALLTKNCLATLAAPDTANTVSTET